MKRRAGTGFDGISIALLVFLAFAAGCSGQRGEAPEGGPAGVQLADGDFEYINTSDPLSPEEERLAFNLPPGFEAELFAAEPDIGKPMNIAFDEKGRLWVTQSNEYPFPAEEGQGRDRLSILEDTDGDGRADSFTTFADSLNIPIGVTPVAGGAIAYSIPNVYFLADHDGDDRVDERTVLLGAFGHIDTHGMINNLTRGLDGWIHAGHGYRNTSNITGTDGRTLTMVSGNTFRFRLDGSGVETTTTGRVNPFGFAYDDLGYLYGVDCHSTPIYQLIRGGDYPHFGKLPTGIGFPPTMMNHNHGPTAIAGMAFYTAAQFPPAFRENFFSGNPVSGRINRNTLVYHGSTPEAIQQPDFLVSDDPWFRPVDMKVGPDGALYVADFYNRIIGHYEVPLDHPGRDRQRGRIWRIVYRGDARGVEPPPPPVDWSVVGLDALIEALGDDDLQVRMRVADELVDHFGKAVAPTVEALFEQDSTPMQRAHGLWVLYRVGALTDEVLARAASDPDPAVRVHAMRVLLEYPGLSFRQQGLVMDALGDENPHVLRAAIDVIGLHPTAEAVQNLLLLHQSVPEEDTHLRYTVRQSLRNHLRDDAIRQQVLARTWQEDQARALADVMVGVDDPQAAEYLLQHLQTYTEPRATVEIFVAHIARFLPRGEADRVVDYARTAFAGDEDVQFTLFQAVRGGTALRGDELTAGAREWGVGLATRILEDLPAADRAWKNTPIEGGNPANPWEVEDEAATGDFPAARMIGSGDSPTGVLTSPAFTLPASLRFYLVGRDVRPADGQDEPRNFARLRLVDTGAVLAETAVTGVRRQWVIWDTGDYEGQAAVFELVDGAARGVDAHIRAGAFDPPVLTLPARGPATVADRQRQAAELAQELRIRELAPALEALLEAPWADYVARSASARALMRLSQGAAAAALVRIVADPGAPMALRQQLAEPLGQTGAAAALDALTAALPEAPYRLQLDLARALALTTAGKGRLLQAAERGDVSPRLLLDNTVSSRLQNGITPARRARLDALVADLEPVDQLRQRLVEQRVAAFRLEASSADRGSGVFGQNCAVCHQVDGRGGMIGPQLDGIGRWGALKLTEKILSPNLRVNEGFRMERITRTNGEVTTALFRREEGEVLVLANVSGEEFTIPRSEVAAREELSTTLMPDQFAEIIPEKDYDDLLAYLLSLK